MRQGSADGIWCFPGTALLMLGLQRAEVRWLQRCPRPPPPTLTSLSRPENQLETQSKNGFTFCLCAFMIYERVGRRLNVCIALQLHIWAKLNPWSNLTLVLSFIIYIRPKN